MKNEGYYVIGGQYEAYNYGWRRTLHGAKCLAAKCEEYWDNWQGWHRPTIWNAADCEMRITFYRDYEVVVPCMDADPVAVWNKQKKKWIVYEV